jgi:hypothetical protein
MNYKPTRKPYELQTRHPNYKCYLPYDCTYDTITQRIRTMTMPHPMWSECHQLPLDLDPQTIGKLTQSTEHSSAEIYGAYKRVDK